MPQSCGFWPFKDSRSIETWMSAKATRILANTLYFTFVSFCTPLLFLFSFLRFHLTFFSSISNTTVTSSYSSHSTPSKTPNNHLTSVHFSSPSKNLPWYTSRAPTPPTPTPIPPTQTPKPFPSTTNARLSFSTCSSFPHYSQAVRSSAFFSQA